MQEFFGISSSFAQMTPQWVAGKLCLLDDEHAAHFAVEQTFSLLLDEFQKEGKDPATTRKDVTEFMLGDIQPRYDLYQKYAPLHFPDHAPDRRDAMIVALIGDGSLQYLDAHSVPDNLAPDLIFAAYAFHKQAEQIVGGKPTSSPIAPESLFLAQIEALSDLEVMRNYLPQYRMSQIQEHTSTTLLNYAHMVDAATPAGRDLYSMLTDITEKIELRCLKSPELSLVPIL